MNRLAHATSPYLLQHRDNPVHWWEWGEPALAEAQASGRPILLSIGYAACHWCHVMAHESFEDAGVAQVMNALFVNIKVDREERPDVDHVYMSALHALGEPGGWPLTMFLTPKGEPFWGGTYFPKTASHGRPGFVQVLQTVAHTFAGQPDRIARNRDALLQHLSDAAPAPGAGGWTTEELDAFGAQVARAFDPVDGGLKGAPKFPNPAILEFVARWHRRGDGAAPDPVRLTLTRMALGGIHDHLGGGFARYSVDGRWLVPHFEKMLYDNAQLLDLYALYAVETGEALFREAAEGIVGWLAREMTTPAGAFAASLDADSEGEEGRFYVWSPQEIEAALGDEGPAFCAAYDVSPTGNFEGASILNRLDPGPLAAEDDARLAPLRARLLAKREERIRPGLDDKVLADWNGLMVTGLVRAGLLLDRSDWIAIAERAYTTVVAHMSHDGRLGHAWRRDAQGADSLVFPGFALDYAAMMRAGLALYEATGESVRLEDVRRWQAVVEAEYRLPDGRLAMTSTESPQALVTRPQPTHDDAVPNANGVYAEVLVRLAAITHDPRDLERAETILATLGATARTAPAAHMSILSAFDQHLRATSVVVMQPPSGDLRRAALALPYLDRSVSGPDADHDKALPPPLPAAAPPLSPNAALVCAGQRCGLPVSEADALLESQATMLGRVAEA